MPAPVRAGFTLPFVIIALGAVGIMALTFVTVTIRDASAVDRAAHAQRLAMAANAALALAMDRWRADSLWAHPLSAGITRTTVATQGDRLTLTVRRTHPLVAVLDVDARYRDPRHAVEMRRHAQNIVWLEPPDANLTAALTAAGDVTARDPTLLSGVDLNDAASPCGADRDTLSVGSVTAYDVSPETVNGWTLPQRSPLTSDDLPGLDRLRLTALRLGPVVSRSADPAPVNVTGSTSPNWQLLSLQGPVIRLNGNSHHRGLLLIDGDLVLTGTLALEGLLVVSGALDARGGALTVHGAVVVLGNGGAVGQVIATLGHATRVQFDRCRVGMALATVATPRMAPFQLWNPGAP
ncbi:MAG TPA: hypothetical protein VGE27_16155 [Gemmatimonas sp.]|uniref:hypothetical protein n=1 Tax=Gemmatimonas sp. TaxID=1962908 RepID=UPI002EDBA13A